MKVYPKLPVPTRPMTEGELYCSLHMVACEDNGECVLCEWGKAISEN